MQQLKLWIVIKQSTILELKRSQQSEKQSEQCSVPPKGPFLTDSWSWMKSSARHAISNQQAQVKALTLLI